MNRIIRLGVSAILVVALPGSFPGSAHDGPPLAAPAERDAEKLRILLEEIRDLKAQMKHLEEQLNELRGRLGELEEKPADPSREAATPLPERARTIRETLPHKKLQVIPLPERSPPLPARPDSVDEVLRLQIHAPHRLLEGIHEREEQLRRRPFPPETIHIPSFRRRMAPGPSEGP